MDENVWALIQQSEYGLLWFSVLGEAGVIALFARWATRTMDRRIEEIRADHEALRSELKRTIGTLKDYYDRCERERKELQDILSRRERK